MTESAPCTPARLNTVKISHPPMIGPMVVPNELNPCDRLSRLEAVRSGPQDGHIGIGGNLEHGQAQADDEQRGQEERVGDRCVAAG